MNVDRVAVQSHSVAQRERSPALELFDFQPPGREPR